MTPGGARALPGVFSPTLLTLRCAPAADIHAARPREHGSPACGWRTESRTDAPGGERERYDAPRGRKSMTGRKAAVESTRTHVGWRARRPCFPSRRTRFRLVTDLRWGGSGPAGPRPRFACRRLWLVLLVQATPAAGILRQLAPPTGCEVDPGTARLFRPAALARNRRGRGAALVLHHSAEAARLRL